MAVRNYTDKKTFFPNTVQVGVGVGAGTVADGINPSGQPRQAVSGEVTDIIFHIMEFVRDGADKKTIIEALGETYNPADDNQLESVLRTKVGASVDYTGGVPVAGDFVAPTIMLVDQNTGDIYIKKADGTVEQAGGAKPRVSTKIGVPTPADFIDDIQIIKDEVTGILYTKKADGTVTEIGAGGAELITGTRAGVPAPVDFVPPIKQIIDTTNGTIWVLKDDGTVGLANSESIPIQVLKISPNTNTAVARVNRTSTGALVAVDLMASTTLNIKKSAGTSDCVSAVDLKTLRVEKDGLYTIGYYAGGVFSFPGGGDSSINAQHAVNINGNIALSSTIINRIHSTKTSGDNKQSSSESLSLSVGDLITVSEYVSLTGVIGVYESYVGVDLNVLSITYHGNI